MMYNQIIMNNEFIKKLKETAQNEKIEYINVIPQNCLEKYNSSVVGLLPYYAGEENSYFSKYTRGKDYHIVGRRIMEKILDNMGIFDREIFVDISPFNEKELALKAGLGYRGKNGLVINEKYGSFVFIMTAFINCDTPDEIYDIKECLNCKKCLSHCPQNAIEENKINYEKCLSHITQKRQIDSFEEEIIRKNKSAWGCDICQNVCPMNKDVEITPIEEMKNNLLLKTDDIKLLSNKKFKEKYKDYSFSYKGKKILERNIDLIKEF